MSRKSHNIYIASFFIGEVDGPDNFKISEDSQYVLENWESKALSRLVWDDIEIQSVSIEENRAYDDDDGTYLFYLDCEFEITDEQKKVLLPTFEFDVPSSELFKLECGKYSFICGSVEESGN